MLTTFLQILGLVCFSLVLIKATDLVILSLKSLAKITKLGEFAITGLIIGLATSLPELVVGIVSSLEGRPELSLGNLIGANIANVSLVVGAASLIGGVVHIRKNVFYREILFIFIIVLLPVLLFIDGYLSRVDGLFLIIAYIIYVLIIGRKKHEQDSEEHFGRTIRRFVLSVESHKKVWLKFFGGIFLILIAAEAIVRIASGITSSLGIDMFIVGLVLLSVGTTLPEVVFEIEAIKKHETVMVFGNLLGSIAANSLLILGIVSLINPLKIVVFGEYIWALVFFGILFLLFSYYVWTKKRLDRWEGLILLAGYLIFVLWELF